MGAFTTIKDTIASKVNRLFAPTNGGNVIPWFNSSTGSLFIRKQDGSDVEILSGGTLAAQNGGKIFLSQTFI